MKIKEKVLRFAHNQFSERYFPSAHKCYHFVLRIWRCLSIKYKVDDILRTTTLGRIVT